MAIFLYHTVRIDCDQDKLLRWALETAGVSAPPRTITRTTWELVRRHKGENGCTPEQCLTWLLAQFPSVYELTLDGGVMVRATHVSGRLQGTNGEWRGQLNLGTASVPDPAPPTRDLVRFAKRPGTAFAPQQPASIKHVGKARIAMPTWKPRRRAPTKPPVLDPFFKDPFAKGTE